MSLITDPSLVSSSHSLWTAPVAELAVETLTHSQWRAGLAPRTALLTKHTHMARVECYLCFLNSSVAFFFLFTLPSEFTSITKTMAVWSLRTNEFSPIHRNGWFSFGSRKRTITKDTLGFLCTCILLLKHRSKTLMMQERENKYCAHSGSNSMLSLLFVKSQTAFKNACHVERSCGSFIPCNNCTARSTLIMEGTRYGFKCKARKIARCHLTASIPYVRRESITTCDTACINNDSQYLFEHILKHFLWVCLCTFNIISIVLINF